jgi:hypothetical protein
LRLKFLLEYSEGSRDSLEQNIPKGNDSHSDFGGFGECSHYKV